MKKILKVIPLLAVGLVAAFAAAGCAGAESEEPSATKTLMTTRTSAVTYAAVDDSCQHDYEATQLIAATCTEQG